MWKKAIPSIALLMLAPVSLADMPSSQQPSRSFLDRLEAKKGYVLDIRYGQAEAPFPEGRSASGGYTAPKPTEDFLEQARALEVAVYPTDSGLITVAGAMLGYELKKEEGHPFALTFAQTETEGAEDFSLQTNAMLYPGEWTILGGHGGMKQEAGKKPTETYSYTVARIRKR